ncbi:rhamnan synthesis F family protein [Oceaniglobus roseus]|uniref:rhamnan synthesis F family protein n=1 Tax=Oceaniglobus roseus TaxID=1737570 RepID=UPI000C7EB4C7|nr:rhamnan synthesis F family protein [Kandeliimicrobium roseum]
MASPPPLWKIRRELDRLGRQILGATEIVTGPVQRARYERRRAAETRVTPGAQPRTGRVAILVVYQPKGLPPSLMLTCRHLSEQGYATLAVCNTPLSGVDRARLTAATWRVIERPNFGYDFGGYHEGLRHLAAESIAPSRLLLMNDSTWFPVHGSSDIIERMEASPAQVLGAQVFGRFGQPNGRRGGPPMLGSYFLMFKDRALAHPAFTGFWKDYRLSSNKEIVLRRGERALSDTMMASGLPVEGVFPRERFDAVLHGLPDADLHAALRFAVCMIPALEERRQTQLARPPVVPGWREETLAILQAAAESKNFIGSVPLVALRHMGMPFIKKNAERHYVRARHAILAATAEGLLPDLHPDVRAEIEALAARQPDA